MSRAPTALIDQTLIDAHGKPFKVEFLVNDFAQTLRRSGYLIGIRETSDAVKSLAAFDILNKGAFAAVLRCAFVSDYCEWKQFQSFFDAFWLKHIQSKLQVKTNTIASEKSAKNVESTEPSSRNSPLSDYVQAASSETQSTGLSNKNAQSSGASAAENLEAVDLRNITDADQLQKIIDLTDRLAKRIRYKLSRRKMLSKKRKNIHMRKVLQKCGSLGGLPLKLFFKRPKNKPFKLVVLLDVSGSMDNYSKFFMRFMYGLMGSFNKADAFIFHTKLIHISSLLRERNPIKVMERMSLVAQGWSGGTKIGDAIEQFNTAYSENVMSARTMVIIVSDGYDTGPPEKLSGELRKLRSRAKRVIWLNPMLGWDRYEPKSAAMSASLPFIDLFASAHNLESLAALEPEFARI